MREKAAKSIYREVKSAIVEVLMSPKIRFPLTQISARI